MRFFLVSYAYRNGFGRKLFGREGPVSEECILYWEKACAEQVEEEGVCLIAISEIDGPITPKEQADG